MSVVVTRYGEMAKNVMGSGACDPRGSIDTWKQYYIRVVGHWPVKCSIMNCNNRAVGGGHVNLSNYYGVFIIPMCSNCNNAYNTALMPVEPGTRAAKVNQSDTHGSCGSCY